MSFIKIGYDDEGKLLCTLCNGEADNPEFYYTNDKGACKKVKDSVAVEFTQENLKKMMEVFNFSCKND